MRYNILKNYLLLKMEKGSYLNDEEIKLIIKAIDKASEQNEVE